MKVTRQHRIISDPPWAKFLYSDTRFSVVWLALRLWVGWSWLDAGWHKVQEPAYTQTGEAIKAFWTRIAAVPAPPAKPTITYDWYRGFIQGMLDNGWYTTFGPLVAWGETLVGVALILGAFTGVAAAVGGFMNVNFMLAGSASTNPTLLIASVFLVLAWKTAGYIGLDNILLPAIGTPWHARGESPPDPNKPVSSPRTA